jgi:hypothetical protein
MATALPNQAKKNKKWKNLPEEKQQNSDMVAMTFQGRRQGRQLGRGHGGGGGMVQQHSDKVTLAAP